MARSLLNGLIVCANLRVVDVVSHAVIFLSAVALISDVDINSLQFRGSWSTLLQFHNNVHN